VKRALSSAMASSSGATALHRVRQLVPSWRASPAMLACSRRSWLNAHHRARTLSNPRGGATRSSCSVNTPTGHAGTGQHQVRLRHTRRTGRPKDGASMRVCTLRPWLAATAPQSGHPTSTGADSTVTVNRERASSTATTCNPGRPTSRSQHEQYNPAASSRHAREHDIESFTVEVLAGAGCLVAPDPQDLDPNFSPPPPPACRPPPPPPEVRRA